MKTQYQHINLLVITRDFRSAGSFPVVGYGRLGCFKSIIK